MLSNLVGLFTKNVFFVSRQKMLQRKRKITSKKQKVAKKKFLEHDPKGSYTHELKILQIQKELDKKMNRNHHLNELMDELFYPDVRYANEKLTQQNLLKISMNPEENKKLKISKTNQTGEIPSEQAEQFDAVAQQIYLCQIPSQLFQLYLKNSQFFNQSHFIIFFDKLEFYFKNKQTIQQRVTQKWKRSLQKLKLTDLQKKKKKRCPYIFIEQDELIRDEHWNKIVKDINKKIELSTKHIAGQQNEENPQSQELETLDESIYSLENNCDLAIKIKISANYLPEQIFQSIVQKAFAILNLKTLEDQTQNKEQKLPIFSHQQKVKLLGVLALKSATKSTFTKPVYIDSPEASQKQEQNVKELGKKLCEDILRSDECTSDDVGTIILSDQGHYKFLDASLLELAKPKILKNLSKTGLQRSIDYMRAFWSKGSMSDLEFGQVLLFDIYRKLPYSISKGHLFELISFVKDWKLNFVESKVSIKVSEVYPKIIETVSKYLNNNALAHEEIKTLLNSIYENYPFYKVESRGNILELISTSIVKMGEGFKLEELTELFFKTTIMGHKSKIFSKYVFERYQKEYKNLMKEYKSERVQLIVDKTSKFDEKTETNNEVNHAPSMKEVVLQQSLVMMFWGYVINLNAQNASLPLSDMLELFPLYIYSHDPMINDLRTDLNAHLKEYNFFPEIRHKTSEIRQVQPKRSSKPISNPLPLIMTNTCQEFKYRYNESIALQILEKLQGGKEVISDTNFDDMAYFLMKYCLLEEIKVEATGVSERWNYTERKMFEHRVKQFTELQNMFVKEFQRKAQGKEAKVASRLMDLVKKRKQTSKRSEFNPNSSDSGQKPYKLYQLL